MIRLRGWPKRFGQLVRTLSRPSQEGEMDTKTQSRQTDGLRPRAGDFRGSLGRDLPSNMKATLLTSPVIPAGAFLYSRALYRKKPGPMETNRVPLSGFVLMPAAGECLLGKSPASASAAFDWEVPSRVYFPPLESPVPSPGNGRQLQPVDVGINVGNAETRIPISRCFGQVPAQFARLA
jgi:hypothetical protein